MRILNDGCGRMAVGGAVTLRKIAGLLIVSGLGATVAHGQSLVQNRIAGLIRSDQMQPIQGTVSPRVAMSQDEGPLSGSTAIQGMSIVLRRSAAQEADLKKLLVEQQTPGSPTYHQWLRPGEFAARYGVSQQDLAKIATWLKSQGFTVDSIPGSADRVKFSGTAAQVNAAFQTELHRYVFRGESQWANATAISVPQAIAAMTLRVGHLNTFRPLPHLSKRQVFVSRRSTPSSLKPQYTVQACSINENPCPSGDTIEMNLLAPSDIATIYDVSGLYNNSITGTGQTMAVVGQTDIVQYESDIKSFRSLSGLNASNLPTQVLVPGTGAAAVSPNDLEEADIDVEWSGAVAKDASILYVTVGNNQNYSVFNSLEYAIQIPLINKTQFVPVISISYGGCELEDVSQAYIDQLDGDLKQANAQGQTVVAASGDDGSAQCDDTDTTALPANKGLGVNYPSSSQYATGVGGTSFSGDTNGNQSQYWNDSNNADNGSAISYIPETTWNNSPNLAGLTNVGGLSASGGGASKVFSKPTWQTGVGVPNDGKRDVPDVSLAADPEHDGYVLCTEETNNGTPTGPSCPAGSSVPYFDINGQGYLFGGTSISAPQMAAMITLWNQEAGNTNGVGNANPILYSNAKNTPAAFHDVTTGSNAVVCKQGSPNCISNGSGGYVMSCCNAGAGYDEATGLGSVDATAMGAAWPKITVTNPSQPTFTMVSSPASLSIAPGSSATASLVLTPGAGFTGSIALACSGLPANTTCGFSPTSVSVASGGSGAAQTVTLTIANTASARLVPLTPPYRNWPAETALAGLFGLFMLGVGKKRRFPSRWASRWMAALLLAAGLMAASALVACGSGAPSAPSTGNNGGSGGGSSSTSTISVSGTSANSSVTDTIQLTIT